MALVVCVCSYYKTNNLQSDVLSYATNTSLLFLVEIPVQFILEQGNWNLLWLKNLVINEN